MQAYAAKGLLSAEEVSLFSEETDFRPQRPARAAQITAAAQLQALAARPRPQAVPRQQGNAQQAAQTMLAPAGQSPRGAAPQPTQRAPVKQEPQVKEEDGKRKPLVTRERLEAMVREVDPTEKLDPEVYEILYEIADDFVASTTALASRLARHRGGRNIEPRDLGVPMDRLWGLRIPGISGGVPGVDADAREEAEPRPRRGRGGGRG
ncbi:transcription initiation factor TFIID subunit A-domain-containing protein [Hyaloraphidium curvatum]|nr:transcription initiation factor TFIID subunit A-domain-containing protein [Hyaloraphidium curvatum]